MDWPLTIVSGFMALLSLSSIHFFMHVMAKDPIIEAIGSSKDPNERTSQICHALTRALPHKVFRRSHPCFVDFVRSFWSAQEQSIVPECVVQPTSPQDVATAIRVLSNDYEANGFKEVKFAIRSGGHAPNFGFANVESGIALDLSKLNHISVSQDQQATRIGPGARWIDVSQKLDPMGLAVAGGRVSNAGVAGLALGGGISFFSPRMGFVADNITDYEVVLSDGSIINANGTLNRDLWIALKGGGNNFGIVTNFTVRTFVQGKLWAGYHYYSAAVAPQILDGFYEFCKPETYDENSNTIVALGYNRTFRTVGIGQSLQYTKAIKNPQCHKRFRKIKRFWSTVKLQSLSSHSEEINAHSPPGFRQLFRTTTFESNLDVLFASHKIYLSSIPAIKSVKGIVWSLVFQPLPPAATSKSHENALGVETSETLVIALISTSWKKTVDDEVVLSEGKRVIDEIEESAKSLGVYHPYKYVNYASSDQKPLLGYGNQNVQMLREVSRKYDPHRIFQNGCVGGFKVDEMTALL